MPCDPEAVRVIREMAMQQTGVCRIAEWLLGHYSLSPSTGGLQVTTCLLRAFRLPLREAKTINAWQGLGGTWSDAQIEADLWPRIRELQSEWAVDEGIEDVRGL